MALEYAAALQNKDAAAVAALSAPTIAFADTASGTMGSSPGDVQRRYAKIFDAGRPGFRDLRYAVGRGWAAVIWPPAASRTGRPAAAPTMLEIRNGKVRRETPTTTVPTSRSSPDHGQRESRPA